MSTRYDKFEAAIRRDQIEKDAQIAEDAPGTDATGYYAGDHQSGYQEAQRHIVAALRAQIGDTDPVSGGSQ